jgi:hypothetical protein
MQTGFFERNLFGLWPDVDKCICAMLHTCMYVYVSIMHTYTPYMCNIYTYAYVYVLYVSIMNTYTPYMCNVYTYACVYVLYVSITYMYTHFYERVLFGDG